MSQTLKIKLPKAFEPNTIEQKVYSFWEEGGFFAAEESSDKPSYCIVIPPPNITGALHMGHALTVTIQDMLIRWRRMQGYNTLWLPGTDHAGIATQMVVERQLKKEGTDRHKLGREKFIERIWDWKNQYGNRITQQLKRTGVSLDWPRERFTMDDGLSRAVREAFVLLYESGKVVRDNRLINWCNSCRTALSEVEVDRDKPEASEMWSFAYKLVNTSDETNTCEIIVATTRPETMLGDTAIAVHPKDDRYKDLIGQHVQHPFQDRTIPIIADDMLADPEKGTGAVKVTPAHDPNDFNCGKRNNLEFIDIFNNDGTLNDNGAPFAGIDRFDARKQVKKALTDKDLFRGTAEHEYAPGRCQRCRTVVEPKLSLQWFVDTAEMSQKAIDAVKETKTTFVPQHQEKRYTRWLEAKLPWCISRQLWWGHRIPAWYCDDCSEITVSRQDPTVCIKCGSSKIHQDEDVLDTWFSSALWPFSTLGWPDNTDLLKTFYPTSVLETGYDILTFWVSRMMIMALTIMDEVPFKKVLLHPMVRDQDGNKMSKSRGNVIDPLDVMDGISLEDLIKKTNSLALPEKEIKSALKYQKQHYPNGFEKSGADALRYTLAAYTGQDQDIRFNVERVETNRKFCNKIWQAVLGFAMPHLEGIKVQSGIPQPATLADRWILTRLSQVISEVNKELEAFRVGEVTQLLYQFFCNELCGWYIEFQKPVLMGDDTTDGAKKIKAAGKLVLCHVLDASLKMLHPLMPFVTEVLWQQLPKSPGAPKSIMLASFPTQKDGLLDNQALADVFSLMDIITAIRTVRAQYDVAPSKPITVKVRTDNKKLTQLLLQSQELLFALTKVEDMSIDTTNMPRPSNCATAVATNAELLVPLKDIIDFDAEKAKLQKEQLKCEKDIQFFTKKLSNEKFIAKAPPQVIEKENNRREEARNRLKKIEEALTHLINVTKS